MREDLRPYWLKKTYLRLRDGYVDYFLRPRCVHLGPWANIMKPWYVNISGANIRIGRCFTAIGEPMHRVEIGVWGREAGAGRIDIGDCVLMSPGSRLSASDEIVIGDGAMLANGAYVTDSDWHTLYDRTRRDERVTPVHIGANVWLGDHATVLKGVTIGANSVVAARAVVTKDVPANVVVAGNPARVVRELDPQREMRTRLDYFADPAGVERFFDAVDREVLAGNTFLRWLWSVVYPRSAQSR
jgi:acetyltransferase-like isoleucine patch superfamily enzyme